MPGPGISRDGEWSRWLLSSSRGCEAHHRQATCIGVHQKRARLQEQLAAARARIGAVEDADEAAEHAEAVSTQLRQALQSATHDPERFRDLCRLFLTIWLYPDRRPKIETRIPPSAAF